MDSTLVAATLVSLAMALALSVVVWRLLKDERRRSNARVAALAELAARPDAAARTRPIATPVTSVDPRRRELRPLPTDLPLREASSPPPVSTPIASAPLFAPPQRASAWHRRIAIMAALALLGASGVFLALTVKARQQLTSPPGVLASASSSPSLELLSLRDARDANTLTITGLVENPRGGTRLTRVSVTAFAFDQRGAFLASGNALLDVTSLSPGDESPFVVSVPLPTSGAVARYRVSFRGEDGRVISHIDKRQPGGVVAAARPVPTPGL